DGSGRTTVAVYDVSRVSVRAENTVLVTGSYDQSPSTCRLSTWAGNGSQWSARLVTWTVRLTVGPMARAGGSPFLTGVAGGARSSCGANDVPSNSSSAVSRRYAGAGSLEV